jgi:hypothetical protein
VTFLLDLRKSAAPALAVGEDKPFPETVLPDTGFDARKGLHFPIADGKGIVFQNYGKLSDAAGSMTVSFSFDEADAGGQLVKTWANFFTLSATKAGREAALSAYGHHLLMAWAFKPDIPYSLRADWDCTTGLALTLSENGREVRAVARNATWQPYRQQYIPIMVGGEMGDTAPGHRTWHNTFCGWISAMECALLPQSPPGLPRVPATPKESGSGKSIAAAPGITVLELHDPPIVESPIRFDIIPDRIPNYQRCRQVHPEIEDLYFSAETAYDGLIALTEFAGNLWPHTNYWPWPREIFEARGDVQLTRIKQGLMAGMCGGYAHTMEEICWALGIPARRTQVRNHSSFEAYDHTHDKWVCLEADPLCYQGHYEDRDGAPLSIGEMIAINHADQTSPNAYRRLVRHVPHKVQIPAGEIHMNDPESWFRACYVHMGYYKGDYVTPTRPSYWYFLPQLRVPSAEPWTPMRRQMMIDDWRAMYWSCDRVKVQATWKRRGEVLALRFKPFQAQFLEGYVVSADGAPQKRVKEHFDWRLHDGVNRIEVATKNKLGATGHAWRAVVHKAMTDVSGRLSVRNK